MPSSLDNGQRSPRKLLAALVRRLLATPKGETMHAALVKLTINADEAPAAAAALSNDILPTVRSAPGFVAGYWLEPVDGEGFSFVVFETEEQARRSAPPASDWAAPGVTITDVDFRRVAANA